MCLHLLTQHHLYSPDCASIKHFDAPLILTLSNRLPGYFPSPIHPSSAPFLLSPSATCLCHPLFSPHISLSASPSLSVSLCLYHEKHRFIRPFKYCISVCNTLPLSLSCLSLHLCLSKHLPLCLLLLTCLYHASPLFRSLCQLIRLFITSLSLYIYIYIYLKNKMYF